MSKKWIKSAINPENKGKFSEKAARAGETTRQYAEEKQNAPGTLGKEARLAKTLMGMKKGKAKDSSAPSPSSLREKMYGKKS